MCGSQRAGTEWLLPRVLWSGLESENNSEKQRERHCRSLACNMMRLQCPCADSCPAPSSTMVCNLAALPPELQLCKTSRLERLSYLLGAAANSIVMVQHPTYSQLVSSEPGSSCHNLTTAAVSTSANNGTPHGSPTWHLCMHVHAQDMHCITGRLKAAMLGIVNTIKEMVPTLGVGRLHSCMGEHSCSCCKTAGLLSACRSIFRVERRS